MRKRGIRNFLFHLVAAVCAVLALCHFVWTDARACDVAVVSGKITANGRPLIWKNRDCSALAPAGSVLPASMPAPATISWSMPTMCEYE